MGKNWYWAGRSSKRGGTAAAEPEIPSGCMCAAFQFLDFHPFHFPINQQQASFKSSFCMPEDQSVPKGAEAPRNSLESEDGTVSSISKEENLKIPKNIRIKTSGSPRARSGNLNNLSSEISSSPGTKTPTLVARLMGIDILPVTHSSSSSSSSCLSTPNRQGNPHLHHLRQRQHIQIMKHRNSTDSDNAATRSLPETPRMSSARRSDVDHHRLSLQIHKENMGLGEELELPRFSFSKRKYEEHSSRSPSHYARQIVKQIKESVSRKVGHDITNTVKNREHREKEAFVGQFRFKKSPKISVKELDESSPGKHSNPSNYSPRLRFMDNKHKPSTKPSPLNPKDENTDPDPVLKLPSPPPAVDIQAQLSRVLTTKAKPCQPLPEQESQNRKSAPKCKKSANEKFNPRLKKPPQQEESFIIRAPSPTGANDIKAKSKRTHPLPRNLINNLNTVVPNLLPVKTNPSPPATKIPQKQNWSQVSVSRQRNKQEATRTLATRGNNDEDKSKGASTTATTTGTDDHGPEFQYVTGILSRTGAYKCTGTTTTVPHLQFQWLSPTQPLDPSIFHHLEQHPTSNSSVSSPNNDQECIFTPKNQLGPRCNRRLMFDLVDEVLLEILTRPKLRPLDNYCWLMETVWKRIRSFPRENCQVLEDIDGVIEREDMKQMKMGEEAEALLEEGEGFVKEMEGNILETLVHETVMVMVMVVECGCRCSGGFVRKGRRRLDGDGKGETRSRGVSPSLSHGLFT